MDGLSSQIGRWFRAEIAAFPRRGIVLSHVSYAARPADRPTVRHSLAIVELKTIAVILPRERNYAKTLMMITSASHTTKATDA